MPPTRAESAELPEAVAKGACKQRDCRHNHIVNVTHKHKHKHKAEFNVAVSGPGKPFIAIGPNANLNHNVGDRAATDEGECSETACGTSGAANNSFEEVGCNEKDRSKSPTAFSPEETQESANSPASSVFPDRVFQGPGLEKGFYDDLKFACCYNESALSGNWVPTRIRGFREMPSFSNGLRTDLNEQRTNDQFQEPYNEEQIISLLPSLEVASRISGGSQDDQIVQLARFSEIKSAPTAVKHSLKLLEHLLRKEYSKQTVNAHIKTMETILRQTVASVSGIFMTERTHAQRLRVSVYSHVLCIMTVGQANGSLPRCFSETERQQLRHDLRPKLAALLNDLPYRRHDRMRYSMELILEGIKRLCSSKSPHLRSQLQEVLRRLKDMLSSENCEEGVKDLVKTLYEDSEQWWFDMHIAMHFLFTQVLNGNCSFKALWLLHQIILNFQTKLAKRRMGKNKDDWKFVLLTVNVLVGILSESTDKEIRSQAASSIANLIGCKNIQGSHDLRSILEKYSRRAILCPHVEGRHLIINSLLKADEEVPSDICYKHLCAFYKINNLEILEEMFNSKHAICYRAKFQDCPGALKILKITSSKSLCIERSPSSRHERDFVNEAYYLRRLNQEHHPNILRLLAFDTIGPLCHMITEYMHKGTTRQFLMNCRHQKQIPPILVYIAICQGVIKAMVTLSSLNIVHRDLRADHVFVGEDNCCKLGGFKSAVQIETAGENVFGEVCDYIPLQEDHRQRWAAPECLLEGKYSVKSDVWAFGVFMYEVFTCGGIPYTTDMGLQVAKIKPHVLEGGYISYHSCIPSEIYELMKKCWQLKKDVRPTFEEILRELQTIAEQFRNSDSKPLPNPPPLEPLQKRSSNSIQKGLKCNALKRIRLESASRQHVQNLRSLNNPHVTKVLSVQSLSSSVTMVTSSSSVPNLLEYVKTSDCKVNDAILFAAQISSAMKYLHSKDIVHCFLSAQNILVLDSKQVQVSGLQHSRSLTLSFWDEDSSSCNTRRPPPTGALRWCSPEAIQENIFSHASDVWSYGVTLWELFAYLGSREKNTVIAGPYSHLEDKQVLATLKRNTRLHQPDDCPDWLFIVIKQCWLYNACDRPSFFLILDCLTQRNPWKSYLHQLWMKKHEIFENWPNTLVALPKYVTEVEQVLSTDNELRLASTDEFCSEHSYSYEKPFWVKFVHKVRKPFRRIKSTTQTSDFNVEPCEEEEYGEAYSTYANPESLLPFNQPPPLPPRSQEVEGGSCSLLTNEDDAERVPNPKTFKATESTRMRRRDPPVPPEVEISCKETPPPLPPRPPVCCYPPVSSNTMLDQKCEPKSENEQTNNSCGYEQPQYSPDDSGGYQHPLCFPDDSDDYQLHSNPQDESGGYETPPCFPNNSSDAPLKTVSPRYSSCPNWQEEPDCYCDTLGSASNYTALYDLPSSSEATGLSRSSSSVTYSGFSSDTMSNADSLSVDTGVVGFDNAVYDDTAFSVGGREERDCSQFVSIVDHQGTVNTNDKGVVKEEEYYNIPTSTFRRRSQDS